MGYLEKFLIHHRSVEIADIEANMRMASKAGRLGTAFRKLNLPSTRKMSNEEYVAKLRLMRRERLLEIRALRRFEGMV